MHLPLLVAVWAVAALCAVAALAAASLFIFYSACFIYEAFADAKLMRSNRKARQYTGGPRVPK